MSYACGHRNLRNLLTFGVEKERALQLQPGDRVCVEIGGGYGAPAERTLELSQRDLDAGYVTAAGAEQDYGVKIGPDGTARR